MDNETLLKKRLEAIYTAKGIDVVPKKMFGGFCFLYKGKMTVGITGDKIVVRIISEKMDEIMAQPYSSPMDFTGKVMKEFVFISEDGFKSDFELEKWVDLAMEHAKTKLKEI